MPFAGCTTTVKEPFVDGVDFKKVKSKETVTAPDSTDWICESPRLKKYELEAKGCPK